MIPQAVFDRMKEAEQRSGLMILITFRSDSTGFVKVFQKDEARSLEVIFFNDLNQLYACIDTAGNLIAK